MTKQEALYTYLLRLGDNSLVLGHRIAEICSYGPILEEDLALTNMALDHIGRASAFLKYAGEVEGKGKTEDDLAYKRGERHFYNKLITEMPNGNFAYTIARQLYVAAFELNLFEALSESKDETIAGISQKAIKEVKYHLAHAADWTCRLGDGTEKSKAKIQFAIDELWSYTGELFEMDEVEALLINDGIAIDSMAFKAKWHAHIAEVLKEATLIMPEGTYTHTGSRAGIHTEHLGHMISDMQYLQRAYPDAKW